MTNGYVLHDIVPSHILLHNNNNNYYYYTVNLEYLCVQFFCKSQFTAHVNKIISRCMVIIMVVQDS